MSDPTISRQKLADSPLDVVVIGAGQAGLAAGYHLTRHGSRFLLLDAGPSVGHAWRSRWDSLRLFTPAEYSSLPGMPFPAAAGSYPTKDQVADYLAAYAERFDLPVLLDTPVRRLTRTADGCFRLETDRSTLQTRHVIVATGPFQVPAIPEPARSLGTDVVQLHSARYRNPKDLPRGRVLVVGGGNSGLQIAEEIAASREVHVAMGSKQTMVPQRPFGRDLFWWLTATGLLTRPATSPIARFFRRRGGDLVIGTSTRSLRAAGVTLRPRLTGADHRTATFADGSCLQVDAVVWATGFRSDYSWIDLPGVWDGRQLRHRRGVTDVPGLTFLGLPWQHTRGSALLGFVQDDAEWIARQVTPAGRSGPRSGDRDARLQRPLPDRRGTTSGVYSAATSADAAGDQVTVTFGRRVAPSRR
ncbi:flavin-containing monooxygenase [Nocardioides mesophilus]|uniref:NAD(P)-binding domain-containing protein n=1 Tax=Nocardioides mesophilus TaxID=433659 RepID=A0A7G9R8B4_9ACTN|nr:NAD(P)/FAD-dependent oxidoreductase [Nocardioides mesophilus]QNN51839.1 NAD(P)-binding domain-containing protein [Nocardioides mesophilus]